MVDYDYVGKCELSWYVGCDNYQKGNGMLKLKLRYICVQYLPNNKLIITETSRCICVSNICQTMKLYVAVSSEYF